MRLELENSEQEITSSAQDETQQAAEEEIETVDDATPASAVTMPITTETTTAVESQPHFWDSGLQLTSPPSQQHTAYCLTEANANVSDPHTWYNNYPTDSVTYALYSGAPSATEMFPYDHGHYNAVDDRSLYSTENQEGQQYAQLVDATQSFPSDYYHEYTQNYSTFEHQAYGYIGSANTYETSTDQVYIAHSENRTAFDPINDLGSNESSANSNIGLEEAPKTESSSSSEEEGHELATSLATIVKETIVSV